MGRLKDEILNLIFHTKGDQARKEINEITKAISDSKQKVKEYEKELSMLAKQGQVDSDRYKELTASIKQENAAIDQNKKKLEEQRSKLSLNDMTIKELNQRIRSLNKNLELLRPGSKEWKQLNKELQATSARLYHLKSRVNETSKAMAALSKVQTGIMGTIGVIYGVARAFSGAFNTIKDFEQANADLATILGKSVTDVSALTEEAERLGRTTKYTASEVTGLQIELAKLGFNEGQIRVMEESVLNFATAVGADLPEAASLAGSTLRMFGLSSKDTEDALATLALATNKSALDFSFFQTAMSTVGPVANTFGFSLKDTTALLGGLANAGFDASSAATATRNILLKLADANGELAVALGGPIRTFDDLIDGLRKLDEKGIDLAGTLELTDNRSVSAFNSFLHGTDVVADLRAELEQTDGVLKDIAEQRANTLAGAIDKLSSAWQGFILKLKSSAGVLKKTVEYLTEIVTWITPGSRHDAEVESTVKTITAGYGTAEGRAFVASRKAEALQSQLNKLDEDLEKTNDRRSKRRIEKEKKRIQKELSVYEDAYGRLKAAAGAEAEDDDITTPTGGTGTKYKATPSDSGKKTSSREVENDNKKKQKELEDAAKAAAKAREEIEKLEEQILQARIAAAKDYNEKADAQVEAENDRFRKEIEQYEKKKDAIANYTQVEATLQQRHANNLLKIELERQSSEMKELESIHKSKLADIQHEHEYELSLETTSSARKLQIQRERNIEIAKENKRFLEEQYKFLVSIVSSEEVNGMKLSMEQLLQYRTQLDEIRKQLQDADAAYVNLTTPSLQSGDISLFGVKQSDWEEFFFNLDKGTLKAKDLQTAFNGVGGMAQEGFKLANQAIKLTNANEKKALDDYKKGQESKKKSLEDRYKAGLMTESQYNDEVEQMEADMKAKQEAMELEQAQRAQKIAIVESIINTFLAASKALAQGGMPAGPIMAGIITALGVAQTAMIAAQPVGYAEGGEMEVKRAQDGKAFRAKVDPKRRGYVDRPTVLVAEEGPEYVISAEALKNPDIRAYADTIESARRTGRLRSLRLEAVNPAAAVTGRAAGGYMQDAAPSGTATVSTETVQEIGRLRETVDRLSTILDAGIDAEVVMTGRNGLVRKFEEYNRMKNRGQL